MDGPGTISHPGFLYTNGNPVKGLQFYADQCNPRLPNNGVNDDAAPLRACMAAMPAGATMNLDGTKKYYFASNSTTDPVWAPTNCETIVHSYQHLKLNGATITQSNAEAGSGSNAMICGGSPNFNTPGSGAALGSSVYDEISDVPAGATALTLVTTAHSSNYHVGDDLYIDCGCNAGVVAPTGNGTCSATNGDEDVFVGYNQVSSVNTTTGVIGLKWPSLKSYNHSVGVAGGCGGSSPSVPNAARIYDYTTQGGVNGAMTSSTYNLGPLAHDVSIEGPGTLISGTGAVVAIYWEGTVNSKITGITVFNPTGNSQFMFANNNQGDTFTDDTLIGQGCQTDINFSTEFTSSHDLIARDIVSLNGDPGVGCGGTQETAFGDAEGAESNTYQNDSCTLHVGLSTNPGNGNSTCFYTNGSWGDVIDNGNFNSSDSGYTDILDNVGLVATGANPTQGPIQVHHTTMVSGANTAIQLSIPGDLADDNTIYCGNAAACLYIPYYQGAAIGNTINFTACSAPTHGIYLGPSGGGLASSVVGNTIHNAPGGGCTTGVYYASGGSAQAELIGNTVDSSMQASNFSGSSLPNGVSEGNPGVLDYNGLGETTPYVAAFGGSFAGSYSACNALSLAGIVNGVATVGSPGSTSATGVVGFNPAALPQNTSGQTGLIVERGTTCGICDGTCTNGDLFEMSPTNNIEIHDIGTSCSGAATGAQVDGIIKVSGTSGSSVAIDVEPGLCPSGSGSVTSVTQTVPSVLTITGSPITTSGTLAIGLATETANTVFAGPASGSAATPTFRAQVFSDLPTYDKAADTIVIMNGASGLE